LISLPLTGFGQITPISGEVHTFLHLTEFGIKCNHGFFMSSGGSTVGSGEEDETTDNGDWSLILHITQKPKISNLFDVYLRGTQTLPVHSL